MQMDFDIGDREIALLKEGKKVSWVEYEADREEINLLATFTAKGEERKGYASRVVEKALECAGKFKSIRISCPYIKRWIEKHGYDRDVEYTELLRFKQALQKFNELRAPEAVATFLKFEDGIALVRFSGPFCVSCGVYDYFEDPIQDVSVEIVGHEEVEDGFMVRYRIKEGDTER